MNKQKPKLEFSSNSYSRVKSIKNNKKKGSGSSPVNTPVYCSARDARLDYNSKGKEPKLNCRKLGRIMTAEMWDRFYEKTK